MALRGRGGRDRRAKSERQHSRGTERVDTLAAGSNSILLLLHSCMESSLRAAGRTRREDSGCESQICDSTSPKHTSPSTFRYTHCDCVVYIEHPNNSRTFLETLSTGVQNVFLILFSYVTLPEKLLLHTFRCRIRRFVHVRAPVTAVLVNAMDENSTTQRRLTLMRLHSLIRSRKVHILRSRPERTYSPLIPGAHIQVIGISYLVSIAIPLEETSGDDQHIKLPLGFGPRYQVVHTPVNECKSENRPGMKRTRRMLLHSRKAARAPSGDRISLQEGTAAGGSTACVCVCVCVHAHIR